MINNKEGKTMSHCMCEACQKARACGEPLPKPRDRYVPGGVVIMRTRPTQEELEKAAREE